VTEPLVYLNGHTVPASEAHLPLYDAGLVMGATVTEMTRTFHRRPWRLADHLDRLFRALKYVRLDIGLSPEQMGAVSEELVAHNARLLDAADELGLIQFVTAGEHPIHARRFGRSARPGPTVCVHTFPLEFEQWAGKMLTGQHLVTPSVRQIPPQCYASQMKCRSRMHYYLAEEEVRLIDPEAAPLLLDLDGNVTETAAANILIVEHGTVVSPTSRNTLPGISRAMAIRLCGRLGIPFVERDFPLFNAVNADEAFLTSTPYCLMPVTKINGVPVGGGTPGPMSKRLLGAWSDEVGVDIEAQIQERAWRRMAPE
jgi:branched-subunit amino acid aminotransferase/4-amino-4-deoxychorismate lyase